MMQNLKLGCEMVAGVRSGQIKGEAASAAADQFSAVLDHQIKARAMASWEYRKKMVPLRSGVLTMQQVALS